MKHWARRSKTLIIAFKIFHNWRMRKRFASGKIETGHGSSHSRKSLAESLSYVDEQFDDYLKYSGLTCELLAGKRILELGFGDNVGVALRFLAAGAARVVCLDKFYSQRDVAREREIYAGLREKLTVEERERFDQAIDLSNGIVFNAGKLRCINGFDLENAAERLLSEEESFDIIISRAVLEEIYEPDRVFAAADRLLAAGGLMLHKIDLSDYGIFADGGLHPLTFLTISESVYQLMASDSGIPNRKLIGYYQKLMSDLGYDARFLITNLLGHGPLVPHREVTELDDHNLRLARPAIDEIRPKLCEQYRNLPDEELMVRGVFLVARKPTIQSGLQE
jgi:SAM-dependent methyltransferase